MYLPLGGTSSPKVGGESAAAATTYGAVAVSVGADNRSARPAPEYPFTMFGRQVTARFAMNLFVVFAVLGAIGQQIVLPVYLSTFGTAGGPFFVLWSCSFAFTLIFGLLSIIGIWRGQITREMRQIRWHPLMAAVGILDSLNGLLIVYASPLSRTPGPLQSVLGQTAIPFTLLFSKVIVSQRKTYSSRQLGGAALVIGAVMFALIPMWQRVADGSYSTSSEQWWWPLIFLIGGIPGVLMNIVQEEFQGRFKDSAQTPGFRRFSIVYFQAIESFYQLCAMTALFWFDLLPNYGTSPDLKSFGDAFRSGWQCFGATGASAVFSDRCVQGLCAGFGILFIAFYVMSYLAGTALTNYASANYLSVASGITPPFTLLFWYAFPSVNAWASGTNYPLKSFDAITNIVALPITLIGVYLFRKYEAESREPDYVELNDGVIELCF
jgi:hypothetical protein